MSFLLDPVKFWLIASRLSGFLVSSPGLNEFQIPTQVKAPLLLWLTLLMMPACPGTVTGYATPMDAAYLIAAEFMLGFGLGATTRMIVSSIQLGGTMIDSELSFMAAQQVNPTMPFTGGIFGSMLMIVAIFYFWTADFFNVLIIALQQSFKILPIASLTVGFSSIDQIVRLSAGVFTGALMIAAPIISLMFFVTVGIGLISKAVQGLPILMEALGLRTLLGLAAAIILLPLILLVVSDILQKIIPAAADYFNNARPALPL